MKKFYICKFFVYFSTNLDSLTIKFFRTDFRLTNISHGKSKISTFTTIQVPKVWILMKMAPLGTMAIRVVEFSNGGYKIRKIFA